MFRHGELGAQLMRVRLQDGKNAGLRAAHHALMDVAKRVEKRPERLEIPVCDGLEALAWLKHVHAFFGEAQVHLNTLAFSVEELCCGAVKKNDRRGEGPVAEETVLVHRTAGTHCLSLHDQPTTLGQCAIKGDQAQDTGNRLACDSAFGLVVPGVLAGKRKRV